MKRPSRAKSVADILDKPEGLLRGLLKQSNSLQSINESVQRLLPEELKGRCVVSEYNQSSLVITAESAVWSTRLRYISSELLANLRKNGHYSLANIQIKTKPSQF
ncbi:DciA family protein [Kangiella shandongensis]|uniref:DciA family protein n=1 Tax=Kangiella shandongensis TaxID=2763258 RepID=UPI001CBCA714|nr:DciA family protein [Kangiella shandongensis]